MKLIGPDPFNLKHDGHGGLIELVTELADDIERAIDATLAFAASTPPSDTRADRGSKVER